MSFPHPPAIPEELDKLMRRMRLPYTELLGPEKVLWKVSDLVKYASDASPYRFVPQVVVVPEDIDDISA
ncbi:hypothetical protein ACWDXT_35145, partial [Streptomyces sp. NPDC003236]